jgi:predicted Zn-dependent peptidase
MEERRDSIENSPFGKMFEVVLANSFQTSPYQWPVLGKLNDVSSITISDARKFHEQYYVGKNMVGVLVGDFEANEAKKLIERYFTAVSKTSPPERKLTYKDKGGGEVTFDFEAQPALSIAYHKPTLPDPAEFIFDVIQVILCDGPTSRLQKRLVYEEKVASVVYCSDSFPGSRLDNLFLIYAEPTKDHSTEELSKKINEELQRLKTEPVAEAELQRVRNKVAANIIYSLEDNEDLAKQLAKFTALFNDWRLLIDYPRYIGEVRVSDIKRIAQRYLVKNNWTEVTRIKSQAETK